MKPRRTGVTSINSTFSPCNGCGAGEVLVKRSPFVVDEFGAAVRRLEELDRGYDDCGRPITVTDEEVRDIADHFQLTDIETGTGLSMVSALSVCFEMRRSGNCSAGQPVKVAVNKSYL